MSSDVCAARCTRPLLCVVQVMHEPCYDALRTKQQLGYTVHCGVRLTHGVLGFAVVVVSGVLFPLSGGMLCARSSFFVAIRPCSASPLALCCLACGPAAIGLPLKV